MNTSLGQLSDLEMDELVIFGILEKLGFAYQSRADALLCMACGTCVSPKQLIAHARNHFEKGFPADFGSLDSINHEVMEVANNFGIPEKVQMSMPHGDRALAGIPVCDAFQCREEGCAYICTTAHMQAKHRSAEHRSSALTDKWVKCKAQHLTTKGTYFSVIVEDEQVVSSGNAAFDAFKTTYIKAVPFDRHAPSQEHNRDIPPFINTTGVYGHLQPWYASEQMRKSVVDLYMLDGTEDSKYLTKMTQDYVRTYTAMALEKEWLQLRPFENFPMYV